MTLDITASSLESTTLPLGLQIHNLLQSYQQVLSHWWRCPVLEVAQSLLSGLIASLSGQALHAISGHFTHSSAQQVIPSCQSLNVDELLAHIKTNVELAMQHQLHIRSLYAHHVSSICHLLHASIPVPDGRDATSLSFDTGQAIVATNGPLTDNETTSRELGLLPLVPPPSLS